MLKTNNIQRGTWQQLGVDTWFAWSYLKSRWWFQLLGQKYESKWNNNLSLRVSQKSLLSPPRYAVTTKTSHSENSYFANKKRPTSQSPNEGWQFHTVSGNSQTSAIKLKLKLYLIYNLYSIHISPAMLDWSSHVIPQPKLARFPSSSKKRSLELG